MATERQIEANRRNAVKSTGPRTADGKARSKMNSLRHGFAQREWFEHDARIKRADCSETALEDSLEWLMEKSFEVDCKRSRLLKDVDAQIMRGVLNGVASLLRRAAALDRYERRVAAHTNRNLQQLPDSDVDRGSTDARMNGGQTRELLRIKSALSKRKRMFARQYKELQRLRAKVAALSSKTPE